MGVRVDPSEPCLDPTTTLGEHGETLEGESPFLEIPGRANTYPLDRSHVKAIRQHLFFRGCQKTNEGHKLPD